MGIDVAHSRLLSSFVYNMYKGEKAEENEGFYAVAVHTGLAALLLANLIICNVTFCSSQEL